MRLRLTSSLFALLSFTAMGCGSESIDQQEDRIVRPDAVVGRVNLESFKVSSCSNATRVVTKAETIASLESAVAEALTLRHEVHHGSPAIIGYAPSKSTVHQRAFNGKLYYHLTGQVYEYGDQGLSPTVLTIAELQDEFGDEVQGEFPQDSGRVSAILINNPDAGTDQPQFLVVTEAATAMLQLGSGAMLESAFEKIVTAQLGEASGEFAGEACADFGVNEFGVRADEGKGVLDALHKVIDPKVGTKNAFVVEVMRRQVALHASGDRSIDYFLQIKVVGADGKGFSAAKLAAMPFAQGQEILDVTPGEGIPLLAHAKVGADGSISIENTDLAPTDVAFPAWSAATGCRLSPELLGVSAENLAGCEAAF